MNGTAIYDVFYRIKEAPIPPEIVLDLPPATNNCCNDFYLMALATQEGSDEFKNDKAGFLWWFSSIITGAELTLYKNGIQVAVLNNDDYGTFFDYKFKTNLDDQNFIGYQLNWQDVLIAFGEGKYWVRATGTTSISGLGGYLDSAIYCLQTYLPERAKGTVRLEYNLSGINGLSKYDEKKIDRMDLNWYNSYRLPGWFFGSPSSEYTKSDVELNSGQRLWVENEQEPEYELFLKPLPQFMHDILRTDFMQADVRMITDYNNMNAANLIQKKVKPNSAYSPNWEKRKMNNRLASVELKMIQEFNNFRKLRS